MPPIPSCGGGRGGILLFAQQSHRMLWWPYPFTISIFRGLKSKIITHMIIMFGRMKTRSKVIIIVVLIVVIPGIVVFGAIPVMIAANMYSGFIMSFTSDEEFEENFAKIPEVRLFIEKHPNYTTSHSGDFLGWKIILYDVNTDEKSLHLYVKKSVLHQGVKISAGCFTAKISGSAYDILEEDVMDYIKNDKCVPK